MKLLVLSAKTGGGHEMRAQAIQDFCEELNIHFKLYRPLEEGSPVYLLGTGLYNLIQKKCPRFHYIYFNFLEYASIHRNPKLLLGSKKFIKVLNDFSPDVVFSVHAHLNHAYFDLFQSFYKGQRKSGKFIVFCGELDDGIGYSKHWINSRNHIFMAPTVNSINAAVKRGMPFDKCRMVGPLMRKPFYETSSSNQRTNFCAKYGIDINQPIGTLATGANGVNSHHCALNGLIAAKNKCQIVALCGNSLDLIESLNKMNQKASFKIIPLPTLDSIEMSILLDLTDWVFGRPGAGLTSEVLTKRKIMYFDVSGGIMPQEQNNLNYFINSGVHPIMIRKGTELGSNLSKGPKFQKVSLEVGRNTISQNLISLFAK